MDLAAVRHLSSFRRVLVLFIGDYSDQGAQRKEEAQNSDLWALGLVSLSGLVSYLDAVQKLANQVFALPGSVLSVLTLTAGVLWSLHVVIAKRPQADSTSHALPSLVLSGLRYSYAQGARNLAKVTLPVFVVMLPTSLLVATDELLPLPTTFYGYLVNAQNGRPLQDVRIRVTKSDETDVTKGEWLTDSRGFYIVETTRRIRRTGYLVVYIPGCSKKIALNLRRSYETQLDSSAVPIKASLRPTFRHVCSCGDKQ